MLLNHCYWLQFNKRPLAQPYKKEKKINDTIFTLLSMKVMDETRREADISFKFIEVSINFLHFLLLLVSLFEDSNFAKVIDKTTASVLLDPYKGHNRSIVQ